MNKAAFKARLKHMDRIKPRRFAAEIIGVVCFVAVRRATGVLPFGAYPRPVWC